MSKIRRHTGDRAHGEDRTHDLTLTNILFVVDGPRSVLSSDGHRPRTIKFRPQGLGSVNVAAVLPVAPEQSVGLGLGLDHRQDGVQQDDDLGVQRAMVMLGQRLEALVQVARQSKGETSRAAR